MEGNDFERYVKMLNSRGASFRVEKQLNGRTLVFHEAAVDGEVQEVVAEFAVNGQLTGHLH